MNIVQISGKKAQRELRTLRKLQELRKITVFVKFVPEQKIVVVFNQETIGSILDIIDRPPIWHDMLVAYITRLRRSLTVNGNFAVLRCNLVHFETQSCRESSYIMGLDR